MAAAPHDTSAAQTFTITAGPVNDAPAGTDNTFTILEDGTRGFTATDFGFSDPVDATTGDAGNFPGRDHHNYSACRYRHPDAGHRRRSGCGRSRSVDPLRQIGGLVFTPAANANGNGEASFTFQVQDDGGTVAAGVDTDQSANTITFDVTAVNDAPAGTDTSITSVGPHTFAAIRVRIYRSPGLRHRGRRRRLPGGDHHDAYPAREH